jgi:hypothetical protein
VISGGGFYSPAIQLDATAATNTLTTIVNEANGTIAQGGFGPALQAFGNASLDLTNKGAIIGPMNFAAGDVALHLFTGSTMTDDLVAGTGAQNTISLNGAGSGSFGMAIENFQTIDKQDSGNWALSGAISGATSVRRQYV